MDHHETDHADVVILGGGFTGATLAYALADGQRRIIVYEARKGPVTRFAGELLHPGRLPVFGEELLARLRRRGADIRGFAIVPGRGQPATLLPYDEVETGRVGLGIDHATMVEELRAAAAERPGVEIRYGARAQAIFDDGYAIGVAAEDGHRTEAPVVLSAEGRHSRSRGHLGVPTDTQLVSFTAALRVPDATLPHPGYGHVFLGAPGPILAYPITPTDVRMCFDLPAGEQALETLRARLLAEYADFVPAPLHAAMLRALDEGQLQLVANPAISTGRCVEKGIALIGDAGGCAHPLTAAGMSVCLNDIGLIREELSGIEPERATLADALHRFETRRYRFVRVRETLTDALYRLFDHDGPSGPALRQALFDHWNHSRAESVALLSCMSSDGELLRRQWGMVALRALFDIGLGRSGPRLAAVRDLATFATDHVPKLFRI